MDHQGWTAPIQMIICLILLILNLGPSAIAGFAFFILATPPQTMIMKRLFAIRQKSMVWTDKRAKLLQELLGGMKVIKFFAWENPFLKRLVEYRQKEMACVDIWFRRRFLFDEYCIQIYSITAPHPRWK